VIIMLNLPKTNASIACLAFAIACVTMKRIAGALIMSALPIRHVETASVFVATVSTLPLMVGACQKRLKTAELPEKTAQQLIATPTQISVPHALLEIAFDFSPTPVTVEAWEMYALPFLHASIQSVPVIKGITGI
jgi:hypothetical protein